MLREIKTQNNRENNLAKRWFNSESMDLIVWIDQAGNFTKFQLCYDKIHNEHALTWIAAKGFIHDSIDDGENDPGAHKRTPILIPDGAINTHSIISQLEAQAAAVDDEIVEFVKSKLAEI